VSAANPTPKWTNVLVFLQNTFLQNSEIFEPPPPKSHPHFLLHRTHRRQTPGALEILSFPAPNFHLQVEGSTRSLTHAQWVRTHLSNLPHNWISSCRNTETGKANNLLDTFLYFSMVDSVAKIIRQKGGIRRGRREGKLRLVYKVSKLIKSLKIQE